MLKARKANRVVRIDDTKAEEYRALGYTVTDMEGRLMLTPNDPKYRIMELEQENDQLRARISELEQEKVQLTARLSETEEPAAKGKTKAKEKQ